MEKPAVPERDLSEVIIESERLTLKPISLEYADDIFREFTSGIAVFMFPQPNDDVGQVIHWIKTDLLRLKVGSNLQMVALNKNGEFLGCVGLHNLKTRTPELGIWLKKSAHGQKYGVEAIGLLVDWANNNLDFDHLVYPVVKENMASRNVAEKNGGVFVEERKDKNARGEELDEVVYHIFPK